MGDTQCPQDPGLAHGQYVSAHQAHPRPFLTTGLTGLKVYTILKYQKLVLTMGAIRELEQRYGDIPVSLETTMLNDDDSTVEDVVEERIA